MRMSYKNLKLYRKSTRDKRENVGLKYMEAYERGDQKEMNRLNVESRELLILVVSIMKEMIKREQTWG